MPSGFIRRDFSPQARQARLATPLPPRRAAARQRTARHCAATRRLAPSRSIAHGEQPHFLTRVPLFRSASLLPAQAWRTACACCAHAHATPHAYMHALLRQPHLQHRGSHTCAVLPAFATSPPPPPRYTFSGCAAGEKVQALTSCSLPLTKLWDQLPAVSQGGGRAACTLCCDLPCHHRFTLPPPHLPPERQASPPATLPLPNGRATNHTMSFHAPPHTPRHLPSRAARACRAARPGPGCDRMPACPSLGLTAYPGGWRAGGLQHTAGRATRRVLLRRARAACACSPACAVLLPCCLFLPLGLSPLWFRTGSVDELEHLGRRAFWDQHLDSDHWDGTAFHLPALPTTHAADAPACPPRASSPCTGCLPGWVMPPPRLPACHSHHYAQQQTLCLHFTFSLPSYPVRQRQTVTPRCGAPSRATNLFISLGLP